MLKAMEGPNPDLYTRSKKTTELSNEFKARYQEALKKYKEFTPSEVGQTKSDEQLKTIHRLASENFGSKKFDLDIDIEFT
jgi:hypothetical protein